MKSSRNWFSVEREITSTLLRLSGVGIVAFAGTGNVVEFMELSCWGEVDRPENEFACK